MWAGAGPQQMLQQQFMQGCALGQQGAMVEMSGNIPAAAQCYDQAAMLLSNSAATAQQYGIPVHDQGWFSIAWCHFNAARTKSMIGWGAMAPQHLMQAHAALNNALSMNPNFPPYHSAMGVLLASEGQPGQAIQAFMHAVQLNPSDAYSQYMLAVLNQATGNVVAGNQYFAAAQQYAPNLPPPQQTLAQHSAGGEGGGSKGFDWNGLVSTIGKVAGAVSSVSGLFENQSSGGEQPNAFAAWGGGGGDWGGGGGYGGGGYGGGGY